MIAVVLGKKLTKEELWSRRGKKKQEGEEGGTEGVVAPFLEKATGKTAQRPSTVVYEYMTVEFRLFGEKQAGAHRGRRTEKCLIGF